MNKPSTKVRGGKPTTTGEKKIYRVYHAFHESDESGTREYGYFSTVELAKKRLIEVMEQVKKQDDEWETKYSSTKTNQNKYIMDENGMSFHVQDGWDDFFYYIQEIEIDKSSDKENVGYT